MRNTFRRPEKLRAQQRQKKKKSGTGLQADLKVREDEERALAQSTAENRGIVKAAVAAAIDGLRQSELLQLLTEVHPETLLATEVKQAKEEVRVAEQETEALLEELERREEEARQRIAHLNPLEGVERELTAAAAERARLKEQMPAAEAAMEQALENEQRAFREKVEREERMSNVSEQVEEMRRRVASVEAEIAALRDEQQAECDPLARELEAALRLAEEHRDYKALESQLRDELQQLERERAALSKRQRPDSDEIASYSTNTRGLIETHKSEFFW